MVEPVAVSNLLEIPNWFINIFIFVLGSIVGSFLNVCIYRLSRDESIIHPRSRCPHCGAPIPLYNNIPLISYIVLRGRAQCCGASFSVRYWVIELITASIFLLIWLSFAPLVAVCYLIFVSLLIVATATDLESYIIPNQITWGGVVAGLFCSALVPALQNESSHWRSFGMSLAGFLVAYGVLWGVVELGKIAFGKKKVRFEQATEITATGQGLSAPSETLNWEDIFSRPTDQLLFTGKTISLKLASDPAGAKPTEQSWEESPVAISPEHIVIGEEKFPLSSLQSLKAMTQELVIPREAMGFGDVKFISGIGAFLGPSSIFFIILASSLIGSVVGLTLLAIGKREWGGKLPYGPYLAAAAVLWVFFGADLISWYKGL